MATTNREKMNRRCTPALSGRARQVKGTILLALFLLLMGMMCSCTSPSGTQKTGTDTANKTDYKAEELIISIFGFGATVGLLLIGLWQYRRADLWKRSEFIAREIETFQKDPVVRNAFAMLDWDSRHINLYQKSEPKAEDMVFVDRELLWKALLPHPVKMLCEQYRFGSPAAEADNQRLFRFPEVAIRDTFDTFLGYLQRFSHFIDAGLVTPHEIGIYLLYWIRLIAGSDEITEGTNAPWRLVLLAYIDFYGFEVQTLFGKLGYDITPQGYCYHHSAQKAEGHWPQLVLHLQGRCADQRREMPC